MAPPPPPSLLQPPPSWPTPDLPFLTFPIASPLLPLHHRLTYCCPLPPSVPLPNPPPLVRILRIDDIHHPAHGQYGLFNANRPLAKGTWIRDYLGRVHTEEEGEVDDESEYDLCLERKVVGEDAEGNVRVEVVGIDATEQGNEARFINDYRRVMEKANAVFEIRTFPLGIDRKGKDLGVGKRMAVYAGPRGIRREEEICVSYGKGFWDARKKAKLEVKEKANQILANSLHNNATKAETELVASFSSLAT